MAEWDSVLALLVKVKRHEGGQGLRGEHRHGVCPGARRVTGTLLLCGWHLFRSPSG